MDTNPIHQNEDGKWYFWDEVWCDEYGPFDSEQEAINECNMYCEIMELFPED